MIANVLTSISSISIHSQSHNHNQEGKQKYEITDTDSRKACKQKCIIYGNVICVDDGNTSF